VGAKGHAILKYADAVESPGSWTTTYFGISIAYSVPYFVLAAEKDHSAVTETFGQKNNIIVCVET